MKRYETVIGLEFHAELRTKTKIFCGCPTDFAGAPNTQVCPVCLGLPGVLPVLNEKAVELAVRAGLALHCEISASSKFDRKNYFYPDLPKGYQVTQYALPVCRNGWLDISDESGETKRVRINRIHMEEDAGKLLHSGQLISTSEYSLADYNRAAVPLIEIVTEADLSSADEAKAFAESLKRTLEYAGVSDVRMEQGSLRCDVNISLRTAGQEEFGTRAEVKNLNSFRNIHRAVLFEEERQCTLLEAGRKVTQETRTWDDEQGITRSMRSKEEAHDYRYFPEPDLPPVALSAEWIERVRSKLPQMPEERMKRLQEECGLSSYDSRLLTGNPALALFFDAVREHYDNAKLLANWLLGDMTRLLKETGEEIREVPVAPRNMAVLLRKLDEGKINAGSAKIVLAEMFHSGRDPEEIIAERGFSQVSDEEELLRFVREALSANAQAAADFRQGKEQALGFLVGQVMRATKGQANAPVVREMFLREMEK